MSDTEATRNRKTKGKIRTNDGSAYSFYNLFFRVPATRSCRAHRHLTHRLASHSPFTTTHQRQHPIRALHPCRKIHKPRTRRRQSVILPCKQGPPAHFHNASPPRPRIAQLRNGSLSASPPCRFAPRTSTLKWEGGPSPHDQDRIFFPGLNSRLHYDERRGVFGEP